TDNCNWNLAPTVEVVGWQVLGGLKSNVASPTAPLGVTRTSAEGDAIVNLKLGARLYNKHGTGLFAGWGHVLTSEQWYEDILRVETRIAF
ncbi:MAG: hypothetical protein N2C14_02945, partial [Planctomycetales bacterium]